MTSSSVLPYFIHDCTTKPRVIATRLAHSSLQMTMRRSCGRSTSEIRWLRNERLARIEPARRRNWLIPFHAGYNRSNPSFFQITNRFDRTHARPERNSGATVRILRSDTFRRCAGVVAAACRQGKRTKHGKPQGVVSDDQPEAREGQAGRPGVAERFVVPRKPGNSGGGKGPQFKTDAIRGEGPRRLGNLSTPINVQKLQMALHAKA